MKDKGGGHGVDGGGGGGLPRMAGFMRSSYSFSPPSSVFFSKISFHIRSNPFLYFYPLINIRFSPLKTFKNFKNYSKMPAAPTFDKKNMIVRSILVEMWKSIF